MSGHFFFRNVLHGHSIDLGLRSWAALGSRAALSKTFISSSPVIVRFLQLPFALGYAYIIKGHASLSGLHLIEANKLGSENEPGIQVYLMCNTNQIQQGQVV